MLSVLTSSPDPGNAGAGPELPDRPTPATFPCPQSRRSACRAHAATRRGRPEDRSHGPACSGRGVQAARSGQHDGDHCRMVGVPLPNGPASNVDVLHAGRGDAQEHRQHGTIVYDTHKAAAHRAASVSVRKAVCGRVKIAIAVPFSNGGQTSTPAATFRAQDAPAPPAHVCRRLWCCLYRPHCRRRPAP
jgi:hypothetical protein